MGSNENRAERAKPTRSVPGLLPTDSQAERQRARLVEALSDLHDLLEEYGPIWYTEEHREKAQSALNPERTCGQRI
jgi:hypothetical protein